MKNLLRTTAFVFLTILLTIGCNNRQNPLTKLDPAFKEYISAYTFGQITRDSRILITLTDSVTSKKREKALENTLFEFDPPIKGTVQWYNSRTLVFIPDERLPAGTSYTGVFNLGEVRRVKKSLRRFPLHLETEKQQIIYRNGSLGFYSQYSDRYMYLYGRVRLNSAEQISVLDKITTAKIGDQELKVVWDDVRGTDYTFRIDSILRTKDDQKLELHFDYSVWNRDDYLDREFMIKGLGKYDLVSVNLAQEPEQKIDIEFSEYLLPSQDLRGLVTLDGVDDISTQLAGNHVYIFFKKRYSGQKKLTIHGMIKNYFGYELGQTYERELFFETPKPQIRLVGNGSILPSSGGVYYPFETVGLKAVDIRIFKVREKNVAQFLQVNSLSGNNQLKRVGEMVHESTVDLVEHGGFDSMNWVRHSLNLRKLVNTEPGAIYRIMLSFKRSYTSYDCPNSDEDNDYEASEREMYYDYYGNSYYYMNNNTPCESNYYYMSSRTRNILVSDLGLMAKMGNDRNLVVFTNDLTTSQTLQGVKVSIYNYSHKKIASGYTNGAGSVQWKIGEDSEPFLLIAEKGNQRGYLKLQDGLSNSLSKFEVDGARNRDGVDGFIYGERGVWRPGDSIYLNFVLYDKHDVLPSDHPVQFSLFDPHGKKIREKVSTSSVHNVYDFRTSTSVDAATGTYRAVVSVGNQSFYHSVKVESVKPNRLKMELDFDRKVLKGYVANPAHISSEWLHGAKASGLVANVTVNLSTTNHRFEGFEDYDFTDPTKNFRSSDATAVELTLDDKGKGDFDVNLPSTSGAPGMLRANFITKVFEKGGNFSIDKFTRLVSPYEHYVGLKTPQGSLEYGTLVTGEPHRLELASVDEEGNAATGRKLQVRVYKIAWRWWWNRNDDISGFISSSSVIPIVDTVLVSEDGKAHYDLTVFQPNWGRYFVQVNDIESGHSTGKIIYIDWPYWARKNRKQNENATMLTFSTDKEKYDRGEKVKLTIPASAEGKALICVENGYQVVKKFWIDIKKGENKATFTTNGTMAPNVYVHVTSVLKHAETTDGQPSRLYGIIPVRVEDPNTRLHPVITMKDSIRPDQKNTVQIKESSGKPMTYTLAIVDEGLLQLTGYHAPNPWNHFYRKQALGVKTWDIYDDVMGSFAGKWGNVLSVGGDGTAAASNKSAKANRFKPVVRFIGPFHLPAGQTAKHDFRIDNYVGAVRVMVIASENNAFGRTSKSVKVKKPLMVLATLPRVLSPGEHIRIPVNVFALNDDVENVQVTVKTNDLIKLPEGGTKTIKFKKAGDEIVSFDAVVKERMGIARVDVEVRSGNEVATTKIELDVRAPNPEITKSDEWVLKAGEKAKCKIDLFGLEGTNSVVLEASTLPPVNLKKRLRYLIQYPHGCVEQTTSSVFPQLALNELTELDADQKRAVSKNVQAGIDRLTRFQTSSGGFAYWPGYQDPNEWGSNYAGHFLVEADRRGYQVPVHVKNAWIEYQTYAARQWVYSSGRNDLIQAYRLYTLALAGSPELAAMNRLREYSNLSNQARWRLAAAYGLAGKPEAANALISTAKVTVVEYRELNNSFGSTFRDMAMMLESMVNAGKDKDAVEMAIKVAAEMSKDRWMSTQETAYGLIALSRYAGEHKPDGKSKLQYKYAGGNAKSLVMDKHIKNVTLGLDQADGKTVEITNPTDHMIYVKVVRLGIPMIGDTTRQQENVNMTVTYTDLSGNPIDVSQVEQGTQFIAQVDIVNPGTRGYLEQMALMQMMPSGWEIQNSRMYNSGINENSYTYRDFRDDRVMTYFNIGARNKLTYKILVTATYEGRFFMPAISLEAMYDHSVRSSIPGRWVEVTKPAVLTME